MKKVVQHFYIQMGMGSRLSHRVLIYVAPTVCVLCFIWGGGIRGVGLIRGLREGVFYFKEF